MKTNFLGYELRGQIIAASCPATESAAGLSACYENGAAAAILKTASSARMEPDGTGGGRRCALDKGGFWARSSFNREIMPLDQCLGEFRRYGKPSSRGFMPVIASITGLDMDAEKWLADCRAFEDAGADAIQLDLFYIENLLAMPRFEEQFTGLLKELIRHAGIPVMPKLNTGLPPEYAAYLLKKAGVEYVSLLDSIKSPAPLEFTRSGQPVIDQRLLGPGLSLFGRFMLPLTRRYTQVLCGAGFKVCAGGGVETARDIAGLLFLGAETVQIASEIILHGFERINLLAGQTGALLGNMGLRDAAMVKERGRTLYTPPGELPRCRARWNPKKCALGKLPGDCYYCAYNSGHANGQAFCERIQYDGHKAIRIDESCEGCGLCARLCPRGAIEMVRV